MSGLQSESIVLAFHNSEAGSAAAIERLLTYEEAGKLLGITSRSVWTHVNSGRLIGVRFGGTARIDPVDLRRFIESAKTHQREPAGAGIQPDAVLGKDGSRPAMEC